jgi:carbamate kinase
MRYVIALGGNAIGDKGAIETASKAIAKLYKEGNEIVVTHGNGPQVGELAITRHESLAVLTAQTQAWIGTILDESVARALKKLGLDSDYSISEVVLTKTIVDKRDRAFRNPTKPIGRFYAKREADLLARRGFAMKKLVNGYRRVVPSPEPRGIVQKSMILELLRSKHVVIACGGGGIPMLRVRGGLAFAEAVIDKDKASALLAKEIGADRFIILTNVDGVYLNFKKKNQELIGRISVKKLKEYRDLGRFESGSMEPKVSACIDFVESTRKPAGIGNINRSERAVSMKGLTIITP